MTERAKVYHRAKYINDDGEAWALCYRRLKPIDLSKASWTIVDEHVTCSKCRAIMRERATKMPTFEPTALWCWWLGGVAMHACRRRSGRAAFRRSAAVLS
jgi:hypothetical protein